VSPGEEWAKHLRHEVHPGALRQHQAGEGMSQIVKTDLAQPLSAEQRLECAFGDVRAIEWVALRIYEHQGVAIGAGAHRQQPLRHASPVGAQGPFGGVR